MKWKSKTAIIGGGLAGITAADAAVKQGQDVTLFESTGVLGGRLASLFDTHVQEYVDVGQHLFFDCCRTVRDVHQSLGLDRFFRQCRALPFFSLDGKRWLFKPAHWLPKSLQYLPAMLRIPFVPFAQRFAVGKLFDKFIREEHLSGTIADYLTLNQVSPQVISGIWEPMVFGILSETMENASAAAVQGVLREVFAGKHVIFVPNQPLRAIYHDAVSAALSAKGAALRLHRRLDKLYYEDADDGLKITALQLANGTVETFDQYILAIPFNNLRKVLYKSGLEDYADGLALDQFELGTITTVHLFFDEPLLPDTLPIAMLSGGGGQFICRPKLVPGNFGYYHTVVISASHRLLSELEISANTKELLVNRVIEQLRRTYNKPQLSVRYFRVSTNFEAIFSPNPLIFENRPTHVTPFQNLTLAGDWTQTGFPATMEGAAKSGAIAAAAR
jgi:squalene-associated FAD-dependent desaturase